MIHDCRSATQRLLGHLEDTLVPVNTAAPDGVFYGWVALPLGEFFAGMEVARQYLVEHNHCWSGDESFLDVGSGVGTKLALARLLGWEASGLERCQPYVEVSRRVFPEHPVDVNDAFAWKGYGGFDLVYSYRLCVDLALQADLERHIVSHMRPGALLFAAGWTPHNLEHVGDQVWRVG